MTEKKALLNALLCNIIWIVLVYLCFSFVILNINFANWSEDARMFYVLVGIICGFFVGAGIYQKGMEKYGE
ncbi:hypothetical protein J2O09_05645 [Elizabethkingia anophelis]|uniref:hypothetical protein n=1 Tax=Elizabethkingia anophelis TaxID=1117645 RepID=UPI0020B88F19|nr:hypothetical protein [Elizabethkingia anophelis]UTG62439.1 hypothetical protein J2O09_05645 [Elizabethkingia anophelis]UXM68723.1 hypothetical protein N7E57_05660 [Elizabethkingia anophelis]